MAIARKKPSPASSKPSKSPTSIAEDPGALATLEEMAKSKAGSAKSKAEGETEAMKTAKKTAKTEKTEKSPKTIKTTKKKPEGSQKAGKIQPDPMVQKPKDAPKGKNLDKSRENSITEALNEVEEYAAEMVQKSRYKDKDPKKVALGIFMVLPECESITNQNFAKHFKIGRNTVTRWSLDKTVLKVRNEFSELYFKRFTPRVINHLVKGAQKTSWVNGLVDTAAIKLFLQYVEKWNEKQEVDVTSDGKAITWGIAPSQFVKQDKIPEVQEDDGDDSDD